MDGLAPRWASIRWSCAGATSSARAVPVHRVQRAGLRLRRPRRRRRRRRPSSPTTTASGPSRPRDGAGATKQLGIGLSTYFEMCGLAPSRVLASLNYSAGGWEAATVRMLPTNKVQVVTGTSPHGQGHETSWSMIVADQLGVRPDDVEVLHSDTAIAPLGLDTYGSRSLPVGGVAIAMAGDKVHRQGQEDRRPQDGGAEDDLEFADGEFAVRAPPTKTMPLAAIAFEAFTAHNLPEGLEPNLEAQVTYDPPNFSWPFGTHICVVEVDTETGKRRRAAVRRGRRLRQAGQPDDRRGTGPGGVVQGMAQALFEEAVHDEDGNLKNSRSPSTSCPPPATYPPSPRPHGDPAPTNQLGVKGIGEAGTIGAAPAVINAVVDALAHLGVTDMPCPPPANVWKAIHAAGQQPKGATK